MARRLRARPAVAPIDPQRGPARPGWVLFALWLLVFSSGSQVMVVAPLLPQLGAALRIPPSLWGTLVTVDALALGLVVLVAGPRSDRVGHHRILRAGSAALTAALLAHAAARSYASFLVARALAGAAAGGVSGASVAYIGDAFPYHRRGWANGWVLSGMAAGQILGIPAGTVLAERFGVRSPFLLFAATGGLAWALIGAVVPPVRLPRVAEPFRPATWATAYRRLLARSGVTLAMAVFALMFLASAFYSVFLPTWLHHAFGATPSQVGGVFVAGGLANVLARPWAGKLSDRWGRRPLNRRGQFRAGRGHGDHAVGRALPPGGVPVPVPPYGAGGRADRPLPSLAHGARAAGPARHADERRHGGRAAGFRPWRWGGRGRVRPLGLRRQRDGGRGGGAPSGWPAGPPPAGAGGRRQSAPSASPRRIFAVVSAWPAWRAVCSPR